MNARRRVGEGLAHRQHRIVLLKGVWSHVEQQRLLIAAIDVRPVHQHAITQAKTRAKELPILHPVIVRAACTIHRERPLVAIRLHFVHRADARGRAAIRGDFCHIGHRDPVQILFERRPEVPLKRGGTAHAHHIKHIAIIPNRTRTDHTAVVRVPSARVWQAKVVP